MDQDQSPMDIMSAFDEGNHPQSLDDFPPDARESVEGLLWLGYLEDEFDFCGHNFVIRTLRGDEELLAALVTKEFSETLGQERSWAWATVALALVAVDGDEDFCPKTVRDKRAYARARFQFCTSKWFWSVGKYLYERYVDLQRRQSEAITRVEDLSRGNLHTYSPSVGSSTNREDSEKPLEEITEYLDEPELTDSNPSSSSSTNPD